MMHCYRSGCLPRPDPPNAPGRESPDMARFRLLGGEDLGGLQSEDATGAVADLALIAFAGGGANVAFPAGAQHVVLQTSLFKRHFGLNSTPTLCPEMVDPERYSESSSSPVSACSSGEGFAKGAAWYRLRSERALDPEITAQNWPGTNTWSSCGGYVGN